MNNETIAKRIAETTAPASVIDAVTELIAENKRQSKELAEQSIKLLVFNEVVAERDVLRATIGSLNSLEAIADIRSFELRTERDEAIGLLRAILKQHGDSSASMMNADRWLFANVEDYQ